MDTLQPGWLTEGWIDFEYKKYMLLGYLQQVTRHFDEKKLYPRMAELMEHYNHLQMFREKKLAVAKDFPKEISRLDFENLRIEYRQLFDDDELLKEIDSIVDFALPQIESKLGLGKELYGEVEDKLEVFPIGILPLHTDEGYLMLSDYIKKLVNVYAYRITIFENALEKFRGIHTQFLFNYNISLSDTYERVKFKLIKENSHLPNPAAYVVQFKHSFPLPETMLPVAKRSLVRYIATSTAA
ncbi:MAG TPA: hypothetical protein VK154_17875 [Chitinophagales bacterium]|nr:hypothetical protein [Chitinophagales bacterium]